MSPPPLPLPPPPPHRREREREHESENEHENEDENEHRLTERALEILRAVSASSDEGISISQLFKHLDRSVSQSLHAGDESAVSENDPSGPTSTSAREPPDDTRKNQIWEALVAREDVIVGDGKSGQGALKKLSLEDVFALGLAERSVRIIKANDLGDGDASGLSALSTMTADPEAKHTSKFDGTTDAGLLPNAVQGTDLTLETNPVGGISDAPSKEVLSSTPTGDGSIENNDESTVLKSNKRASARSQTGLQASAPPREKIRKATFTSYEEMQRQEQEAARNSGQPGVYINPAGSERPKTNPTGRPRKIKMAVFKSSKLNDPLWLESRRGSWVGIFEARTNISVTQIRPNTGYGSGIALGPRPPPTQQKETDTLLAISPSNPSSAFQFLTNTSDQPAANLPVDPKTESQPGPNTPKRGRGRPKKNPELTVSPTLTNEAALPAPLAEYGAVNSGRASQPIFQPLQFPTMPWYNLPDGLQPTSALANFLAPASYKSPYVSPYAPRPSTPTTSVPARPIRSLLSDSEPVQHQSPHRPPFTVDGPATISTSISHAYGSSDQTRTEVMGSNLGHASTPGTAPVANPLVAQIELQMSRGLQKISQTPHGTSRGRKAHPRPPEAATSVAQASEAFANEPLGNFPTTDSARQDPTVDYRLGNLIFPDVISSDLDPSERATGEPAMVETRKRKLSSMSGANALTSEGNLIFNPASGFPSMVAQQNGPPRPVEAPKSVSVKPTSIDTTDGENALEIALKTAESVAIPNASARISAVYNNVIGNLILSEDRSTLKFFGNDEQPPKSPTLTFKVSKITQNPITSVPGSKPMELRIKAKDEKGKVITHCFKVASTDAAYQAANNMRARVVTAIIYIRVRTGQSSELPPEDTIPQLKVVKPFKCEKCGNRFKNKGGLVYHQTQSNTTCNPKFDPSLRPPKKSKTSPKVAKKTPTRTQNWDSTEGINHINHHGSSSEDSVVKWAEQVSGSRQGSRTPVTVKGSKVKRTPTRAYRSLPGEITVLREIFEELKSGSNLQAGLVGVPPIPTDTGNEPSSEKESQATNVEDLARQRGREVMLGLIEANKGLFPGDRNLWLAFVGVWLSKDSQSDALPESKLCSKILDGLVDAQELKKILFSFRDDRSRVYTRTIITQPGVDEKSPAVEDLKQKMIGGHPRNYIPPGFAPPDNVLTKLEAIFQVGSVARSQREGKEEDGRNPRQRHERYSSVSNESRTRSNSSEDGGFDSPDSAVTDHVHALDIDASDSDDLYEEEPTSSKISKDLATKHFQAQRMRDRWAAVKAFGRNTLSRPSGYPASGTHAGKKRTASGLQKVSVPFTPEERGKRALRAALRQQSWEQAFCRLPNPETGAWDQVPLRVKKVHQKPRRRPRLPEPITLMQELNGAWSVRPFGHGVMPIHARPARRTDSYPSHANYLQRIENGHRPIVIPTKNRLFLPAVPSRRFLLNQSNPRYSKQAILRRSQSPFSPSAANFPYDENSGNVEPTKRQTRAAARAARKEGENSTDVFASRQRNPGLDSLPRSFGLGLSKVQASGHVLDYWSTNFEFLKPNTRLDEEEEGDAPLSIPTAPIKAFAAPRFPGESMIELGGIRFVEPKIIRDGSDLGDGSWTLQTWMPDPSWFLRNNVHSDFAVGDIWSTKRTSLTQTEFFAEVDAVAKWELGLLKNILSSGSLAPDYRWINHTISSVEFSFGLQPTKIRWLDGNTFTVETLPYGQLDSSDDDTDPTELRSSSPRKRGKRKLAPASQKAKDLRELQRLYTTRRLTALPADFEGVLDDATAAMTEFGVEIAASDIIPGRRKRVMGGVLSPETELRLIVAVIIIRTIAGGLDLQIDWVLVGMLFPEVSMNFLCKNWTTLLQKKRGPIEKLVLDFQESFLPAYEKGEIPPIDYDHLVSYDWNWLVDWVIKKLDVSLGTKAISLPGSRERLEHLYKINVIDPEAHSWRETYFGILPPVYRRMELSASVPYTIPLTHKPALSAPSGVEIDDLTLAKSWTRAIALTPEAAWDRGEATAKLEQLGLPLVEQALELLTSTKIIMHKAKGRVTAGRSYEATDNFSSALRKHLTESQFIEAAAFKAFLDTQFRSGVACVRSEYLANEGAVMCVTSLQAHGRIRLQPEGVPMNKFGLTGGGYETRKLDKRKLRFEVDIYPTANYIFNEDIELLEQVESTEPPRGGGKGELPVWYGITNILIWDLWKKVFTAVSGILALRTGINVKGLVRTFNPALEEWEVRRLIEWGVRHGVFERILPDIEGWTVTEWWWLIAGRICTST